MLKLRKLIMASKKTTSTLSFAQTKQGSLMLDALVATTILSAIIIGTASFAYIQLRIQRQNAVLLRAAETIGNRLEELAVEPWDNLDKEKLSEEISANYEISQTSYGTRQLKIYTAIQNQDRVFILERRHE